MAWTPAHPIAELSAAARHDRRSGRACRSSCVVLLGGFTTNFIWCVLLNIKNRTGYQYFRQTLPSRIPRRERRRSSRRPSDAPSEEVVEHMPAAKRQRGRSACPMLSNYLFCALAGTTWYLQFFFYTMGETQMGEYKFSSWTLHMASIIIFSTLWGIALQGVAAAAAAAPRAKLAPRPGSC